MGCGCKKQKTPLPVQTPLPAQKSKVKIVESKPNQTINEKELIERISNKLREIGR